MKTKTGTLTGNVVVSQGKNVLRGERVVVNTETGMPGWNRLVTGSNRGSALMTASE